MGPRFESWRAHFPRTGYTKPLEAVGQVCQKSRECSPVRTPVRTSRERQAEAAASPAWRNPRPQVEAGCLGGRGPGEFALRLELENELAPTAVLCFFTDSGWAAGGRVLEARGAPLFDARCFALQLFECQPELVTSPTLGLGPV